MAAAERLTTIEIASGSALPRFAISLATIAAVASALLVYVSGAFLVADLPDAKREVQSILVVLISTAAAYYLATKPKRLLNPLVLFAIVKLGTEIALRGQLAYILDSLAAVLAITVLNSAPVKSFEIGAKSVIGIAGFFALMGLVQWLMLAGDPRLAQYILTLSEDNHVQGVIEHPIALLGFIDTNRSYPFFGLELHRIQSFDLEPSLNVTYFLFPASLAFILDTRASRACGWILLTFCVLSLSGSVYLTFGFCALCWPLVRITSVRFVLPYGIVMLMGLFLFAVQYFGLEPLLDAFTYISRYGEFLYKSDSLISRSTGALLNVDAALSAPLGSATVSNIAGPWLINATLAAGWLGAFLLFLFLGKMGRQLARFHEQSRPWGARRIGGTLLLGALAVVVVFNDYQMSNYAGLVVLAFIYRTMELSNQGVLAVAAARPEPDPS